MEEGKRTGVKFDGLVKSHKSDGTVKSSRCKARESLGMRRTYQYAAVTKDEVQRRPSALLRAVSMSNGRWTFYEAVKFIATITGLKGTCHANHMVGQQFELNCYDSGGLCGFFYHDIFPYLSVMQFGGRYPWWDKDMIEVECPDRYNVVSLRVERKK